MARMLIVTDHSSLDPKELAGRILVIDPTSPEPNRGSFCYLPYILTNYLNTIPQVQVCIAENFTLPNIDGIVGYDHIFVALWSYPQIEMCNYLYRTFGKKVHFFGYYPLITRLGLPTLYLEDKQIAEGMRHYPQNYDKYEHLLLSDCDQHIVKPGESPIKMVPMFTSYGCPRGCRFCSATANMSCQKKKRISLPVSDVLEMLHMCNLQGRYAIHFTDEDFFYDTERAFRILLAAVGISHKWQFIALAHLETLENFINYMEASTVEQPTKDAIWKCLRLVEVGLESADVDLARKMGKRNASAADRPFSVARRCPTKILWLTMTFFPGETIGSLNATGAFLEQHGLDAKEMSPRIVTNGTQGGLGQFFQFYDGTGISEGALSSAGYILTDRPMRLMPSFIPHSFLESKFAHVATAHATDIDFFVNAYHLDRNIVAKVDAFLQQQPVTTPKAVCEHVYCSGSHISEVSYTTLADTVIYLAILARYRAIVEVAK